MKEPNYNDEDVDDHNAVAAVIKDKDGKILMQEHVKYGFWTIPVGKVKSGQGIVDGLKGEIFEECNLVIEDCNEILKREYEYERRGEKVVVIEHLFLVDSYSGELENKEPNKHSEQKFLDVEKIKVLSYLSNMTLLYLKSLGFEREDRLE